MIAPGLTLSTNFFLSPEGLNTVLIASPTSDATPAAPANKDVPASNEIGAPNNIMSLAFFIIFGKSLRASGINDVSLNAAAGS
ncbi:hypothetical protein D3C79_959230 [compost metagenome]